MVHRAKQRERLARRDLRGKGMEGKGDAEWRKSHKQKRGVHRAFSKSLKYSSLVMPAVFRLFLIIATGTSVYVGMIRGLATSGLT
ncbi:hypothetical protein ES705_12885 [subsurface metagenome]